MTMRAPPLSLCVMLVAAAARAGAASVPVEASALKVAVLPIENLTGGPAPTRELTVKLEEALAQQPGLQVVRGEPIQRFLVERRLRQTGLVDRESAKAAAELLGVDALLVTALELRREAEPPKLGLSMRLVRAADDAAILWADAASTAGDEHPGLLGLNLIETLPEVEDLLLGRLVRSLAAFAGGAERAPADDCSGHGFQPKVRFRSPQLDAAEPYSVAVVPFRNTTPQRRAGELISSEFVRQLSTAGPFRVIEPGVVRDVLLGYRAIIPGGVDLETTRELTGALEADLVLSGTILEYEDLGNLEGPRVRFSTTLFDAHTGRVLWQSTSYNRGTDGVFVFELGQVRTTSGLVCRMVGGVVRGLSPKSNAGGAAIRTDRWRLTRPAAAGSSPALEACSVALPEGAQGIAPEEVSPPFIDRRPGKLGEAILALRAIEVRFDGQGAAMRPADQEALSLLARCALTQGHDVVVRAQVAPTPEQLMDAARRTIDALRSVEKLRRERIRLEIRSAGEGGEQIKVLVAVVPGSSSGPLPQASPPRPPRAAAQVAQGPETPPGPDLAQDTPPTPPIRSKPEADAEAAARKEAVRAATALAQSTEQGLTKRAAELSRRSSAVEERASSLAATEKELAGPAGSLPASTAEERRLAQVEERQRAVEKRLRAVLVTLQANEGRRRQEEAQALAELAKARRSEADPVKREAAEDAAMRARVRRQEATADSLAAQEKLWAAVEARLDAQAQRLEAADSGKP